MEARRIGKLYLLVGLGLESRNELPGSPARRRRHRQALVPRRALEATFGARGAGDIETRSIGAAGHSRLETAQAGRLPASTGLVGLGLGLLGAAGLLETVIVCSFWTMSNRKTEQTTYLCHGGGEGALLLLLLGGALGERTTQSGLLDLLDRLALLLPSISYTKTSSHEVCARPTLLAARAAWRAERPRGIVYVCV